MSHFSSDADIETIGAGLLDRTLPKSRWTHAGHFAAALWLWRKFPDSALLEIPGLIRAYNESTGVANTDTAGYHETITLASMRAARVWLDRHAGMALHVAVNELLASEFGHPDWLLAYWSREALFSVTARKSWVAPDIKPLPF